MRLDESDIELIGKYLDGDLTHEEADLLKQRLRNKEFADELRLQKAALEAVKDLQREPLKEELKQHLETEVKPLSRKKRSGYVRHFYTAAVITAILVFASLLLFYNQNESSEVLFTEFYRPYPLPVTRGENDERYAFEYYRAGNFEKAAALIRETISKHDSEDNRGFLRLLLGNCYMNLNKPEEAIATFKSVVDEGDEILAQHARWYIALTLIKSDRKNKALVILREIAGSRSLYSSQAEKLIKSIGS